MHSKFQLKRIKKREPLPKIEYHKLRRNNSYSNCEDFIRKKTLDSSFSENDERKEKISKNIEENCYLKYDFFLYLSEKEAEEKIKKLKSKLIHTKPLNIEKGYRNFKCDYEKMLGRFVKESCPDFIEPKKEVQEKGKISIDELMKNINIHNLQFPHHKYNDIYLKKKDKYPYVTNNAKKETFYHNLERNVDRYYPHFLVFNIRKMLSLYKNFTRKDLYQIFAIYKNLISLCYACNKDNLVLESGIDFGTFWKGVTEISVEKKKFVEKLFMQINKNKSRMLSMTDFFEGMSFIQNTELKEKLDLFLKALDETGKGSLKYDEVLVICKESIKRNLFYESVKSADEYALNELSEFFANFIFKLLNCELDKPLKLENIKIAIIQGSVETQYLEMFCGANKVHGD